MSIIIDPVSQQIEHFLLKNGDSVISAAIQDGLIEKFFETNNRDGLEESERVKRHLDHLETLIDNICAKHSLWKLLFLFRKLPNTSYEFVTKLIPGEEFANSIKPIFIESIVFGTNSILKFSKNAKDLSVCAKRFNIITTRQELEDVVHLMIFCILHRYMMFYQNSISHRSIQNEPSFTQALEIYNRRQELLKLPEPNMAKHKVIISPVFISNIPEKSRTKIYKNNMGRTATLIVKNYLPYPISQDDELEKYSVLDCPEFEVLTGISFDHWWKIWLGLNQVIKNNVIFLWSNNEISSSSDRELMEGTVRADDYSDTALGCGVISSITETCHVLLKREYGKSAPSLDECTEFFKFLSCDHLPGDARFVEQPYLFYEIGPYRVFWDYFRHSGMMRAVLRKLFGESGKAAKRLRAYVASKFEEKTARKIELAIPDANTFKLNVKIKNEANKQTAWEIDTGFIYKNILFLVEIKNWYKPEKYYLADDSTLSSRISAVEFNLRKQDKKLQRFRQQVAQKWDETIFGAICIVCTESVEFTASLDKNLWLKTGEIPRICLVDELISYLRTGDLEELYNHPKFVRFN